MTGEIVTVSKLRRCTCLDVYLSVYLSIYVCLCLYYCLLVSLQFIHSFILAISIAPLQVLYYSEALLTRLQHRCCIGVSRRSAQATVGKGLAQGPYVAARAVYILLMGTRQ